MCRQFHGAVNSLVPETAAFWLNQILLNELSGCLGVAGLATESIEVEGPGSLGPVRTIRAPVEVERVFC